MIGLSLDEKEELLELLAERDLRIRRNSKEQYFTKTGEKSRFKYKKHLEFLNAGKDYKLRLFMAANRVGKTLAAAYELSCHLTGSYPDWWKGKRFTGANSWWVCGVDSKSIISTLQPMLLGKISDFGTGMIPYDSLDFDSLKDAKKADTPISIFRVKHATGAFSTVEFKSYESGRESFQSFEGSIWLDEEAPVSIYTECLMRIATGDNILMMTFTPLKGISETILSFLEGSQFTVGPVGIGKHVTMASWDDVPHLDESTKQILIASIPPYQRDARTKGIPQLGSGAVYPVPESEYLVDHFEIPKNWPRLYGLDVGWNRTAACWLAQNPDSGVWYVYHEYYKGEAEPSIHAVGLKAPGSWINGVIDSAAHGRSQLDGENLFKMYQGLGLNVRNANKAVETGLYTVWEMLSTGQIKVFSSCKNFMDEIRLYRRDEKGKVVKVKDHLMDAFRYAIMGRDAACVEIVARPKPINRGLPSSGQAWA